MAFGKDFCANDGFDERDHRAMAIQAIIDLLTELNGVCVKKFVCKDDSLVVRGKDVVVSIKGEMHSEEQDDKYDFDGENDYFECFILWVETETYVERLSNLDTEDIKKIWDYMLLYMR